MVQLKTEMIKRIEVQHDTLCDEFEDLVFLLLGSDDVNLWLISLSYKFAFNLEFMDIIIYIKTRGLYIIFCAIQHFQYIFIEFYIKNEKHKGNMHAEETL